MKSKSSKKSPRAKAKASRPSKAAAGGASARTSRLAKRPSTETPGAPFPHGYAKREEATFPLGEAKPAFSGPVERDPESLRKLRSLIEGIEVAMLTTVDPDGSLRCRPMATLKSDEDGSLWFFTGGRSGKVESLRAQGRVCLAYSKPDDQKYVSVSGSAEIVQDRLKAADLWSPVMKAWFPEGLDDPDLALIRVRIEAAEYWDAPSSKLVHLIGFTKAILTGERYQPGDHGRLDLQPH